jgi:hypothetical protein
MSKIFVIAGSHFQATEWIKKDLPKHTDRVLTDYVYVSTASDLRGYSNPHGMFIGTWKDRHDIREIVEALMVQTDLPMPVLREIWGEVKDKVKPTPKQPPLHKVSGGWAVAVDDAALMLANAIDDEVLRTVIGGDSGSI